MTRVYDCFLYHDELELLTIRLQLLRQVVHRFVIVSSSETFTGKRKPHRFPREIISAFNLDGVVELIELDELEGRNAWEREWFSRNALFRGITDADPDDLIIVSDVDEIPRPSAVRQLIDRSAHQFPVVLAQDYFNFKLNYQLVHGLQTIWAGPVACTRREASSPQELRDRRWSLLDEPNRCVPQGGWHFSYLTAGTSVDSKLASFAHQEAGTQVRRGTAVEQLIAERRGFHDHLHPSSVWAVRSPHVFSCPELEQLVASYPSLMAHESPDPDEAVQSAIRASVRQLVFTSERHKLVAMLSWGELVHALTSRLKQGIASIFRRAPGGQK